jgi:hypothetical protein
VTSFFHHASNAALPVALMLLAATIVARLTLELPEATPAWRRTAATYLEPLSTWTLGALALRAVTQFLGGGLGGLGIALLLMLAAGTLLLRTAAPEAEAEVRYTPVVAREPRAPRTPAPEPVPSAPLRPTDGALWAGRRTDDPTRGGLWRA